MKDLFILRHAEAVWPAIGMEDRERPLTIRGNDDIARLGAYWHGQGMQFDKIVASPAVRTTQTAYAIAAPIGYAPQAISLIDALHEGSKEVLHELLHAWNNAWQRVLLVSHLPVIQTLLTYLTHEPAPSLPPGGYVHLQLDLAWWRSLKANVGQLVATDYPEQLTNL